MTFDQIIVVYTKYDFVSVVSSGFATQLTENINNIFVINLLFFDHPIVTSGLNVTKILIGYLHLSKFNTTCVRDSYYQIFSVEFIIIPRNYFFFLYI